MRTFFIICLIWMWNVLVRVRLKSDTVHSKFSTVQAGFSLAWVDQTFVSNLCKLFVICSPWVHPLLFSGFSPILIPSTFSHLSFIYTCIAAFQLEIQPYRGTPPKPKPRHKSHKKHAVSLVFAAITLFALLKHSILFLPGSRDR